MILAPRTIVSIARTGAYAAIGGVFTLTDAQARELVDAVLIGGVLADYLTWMIRSLVLLPSHILHGCYDTAVNVVFGWFFYRIALDNVKYDPSCLAAIFLAFLLVMAVKVTYYALAYIGQDLADDR